MHPNSPGIGIDPVKLNGAVHRELPMHADRRVEEANLALYSMSFCILHNFRLSGIKCVLLSPGKHTTPGCHPGCFGMERTTFPHYITTTTVGW